MMKNDQPTPQPAPDARSVGVLPMTIHGPSAERVFTISTVDPGGYHRSFFVNADQAAEEFANALERLDFGESPPR